MESFTINDLKESKKFLEQIRWDVTPRMFFEPPFSKQKRERPPADIEGFMFYIEIMNNRPVLMIMKNKKAMSKTVGSVEGIPEKLLEEALSCDKEDCLAGMYPLPKRLIEWLKKELGVS